MFGGLFPRVEVLEFGALDWGPNPPPLREKLGIVSPLLVHVTLTGVEYMAKVCLSLSYPFNVGFFPHFLDV